MNVTVTVSIGRKTRDGEFLNETEWERFCKYTKRELTAHGQLVTMSLDARGVWQGEYEPCATFTAADFDDYWLPSLRYSLSVLAKTYGQEAIALVVGQTEFVNP